MSAVMWTLGCLVGFGLALAVMTLIPGDSPLLALILGVPLICGSGGVVLNWWETR